jgi:prepilin-type N-terminal cleavage/methylation domain-containing protein
MWYKSRHTLNQVILMSGGIPLNFDSIKNQKGFTLVEIIAVLVILGILTAVAVPKFMGLHDDTRQQVAFSAIFETKARLNSAYGKYFLKNGAKPTHVKDICGTKGLNDAMILPLTGNGKVPLGNDFSVVLASNAIDADITVQKVQGTTLTPVVKGKWYKP